MVKVGSIVAIEPLNLGDIPECGRVLEIKGDRVLVYVPRYRKGPTTKAMTKVHDEIWTLLNCTEEINFKQLRR